MAKKTKADSPQPKPGEVTARQGGKNTDRALQLMVFGNTRGDRKPGSGTFKFYREMSSHPTLALAALIATAPARTAKYLVQGNDDADEESIKLVTKLTETLWPKFVPWACMAVHMGYQPWEIIWRADDTQWLPEKLKPLSQEKTEIQVDEHGNLAGVKNFEDELPPEKCIVYTHSDLPEAGNLYGRSRHENCRATAYMESVAMMKRWARYTKRAMGAIPMIVYPEGEGADESGAKRSHHDIIRQMVQNLEDGMAVGIPNTLMNNQNVENAIHSGADLSKLRTWFIDFLECKAQHGGEFKEGLCYLDQLLLRSWFVPERAAVEAQSGGSRADSAEHGDIADVAGGLILDDMFTVWNEQVIDRVLALNFGKDAAGTVKLVRVPMTEEQQAFYRTLAQGILVAPNNIDLTMKVLDIDKLLENAGLPAKEHDPIGPEDIQTPAGTDAPESSLSLARETYRRMGLLTLAHDPIDPDLKKKITETAGA